MTTKTIFNVQHFIYSRFFFSNVLLLILSFRFQFELSKFTRLIEIKDYFMDLAKFSFEGIQMHRNIVS